MPRRTQDPARLASGFIYGACTLFGRPFNAVLLPSALASLQSFYPDPRIGLGSSDFARRYSRNHFCFLFLRVLRCFSSPGCSLIGYVFTYGYHTITCDGFPHSDIAGSLCTYHSPTRFAVCCVLLQLIVPRHPPYALSCLIIAVFAFDYCFAFQLFSFTFFTTFEKIMFLTLLSLSLCLLLFSFQRSIPLERCPPSFKTK